jgi:hypothetical protein
MHYEITQILLMMVILFLAGLGQSICGFGYALFAITPLIWTGMSLPSAIAIVTACVCIQTILASYKLRTEVPWPLVYKAAVVRFVFVIVGIFFLGMLIGQGRTNVKAVVGGILCLLVLVQMFWRPRPVEAMHMGWGVFSWMVSGLLLGFCGMGGPPLVLWSMAHTWSAKKTRGFLFAAAAMLAPVQLILFSMTFGVEIFWSIGLGVAFFPLVYLGNRIGLPIGNRMNKEKLRRVALTILFFIGISAVAQALI